MPLREYFTSGSLPTFPTRMTSFYALWHFSTPEDCLSGTQGDVRKAYAVAVLECYGVNHVLVLSEDQTSCPSDSSEILEGTNYRESSKTVKPAASAAFERRWSAHTKVLLAGRCWHQIRAAAS